MKNEYLAIILDDNKGVKAIIKPNSYKFGFKLMEHSYIANPFVRAVEILLINEYKGYSLVWCSLKSTNMDIDKIIDNIINHENVIAPKIDNSFGARHYMPNDKNYLINYSKKEYIYLFPFYLESNRYFNDKDIKQESVIVHPLPLLCCDSHNEFDYNGKHKGLMGRWAFDKIGIVNSKELPSDFVEIKVDFKIPIREDLHYHKSY